METECTLTTAHASRSNVQDRRCWWGDVGLRCEGEHHSRWDTQGTHGGSPRERRIWRARSTARTANQTCCCREAQVEATTSDITPTR